MSAPASRCRCPLRRGDLDGAFDETLRILRLDGPTNGRGVAPHLPPLVYPVEALKNWEPASPPTPMRSASACCASLAADVSRRREAYIDLKRTSNLTR
jgi:hypothetical protein